MNYEFTKSRQKHSMTGRSRGGLWMVALLVMLSFVFPSEARADGWVSGFFGRAFGGSTGWDLAEVVKNRETMTYGFNIGGMSGGVVGAEFDFGYTPNFFGSDSGRTKERCHDHDGKRHRRHPGGWTVGAGNPSLRYVRYRTHTSQDRVQ